MPTVQQLGAMDTRKECDTLAASAQVRWQLSENDGRCEATVLRIGRSYSNHDVLCCVELLGELRQALWSLLHGHQEE